MVQQERCSRASHDGSLHAHARARLVSPYSRAHTHTHTRVVPVSPHAGKYYTVNVPLKDGMDDECYQLVFEPIMAKVRGMCV